MTHDAETLSLLDDLLKKASKAGADAADAIHVSGTSMSLSWRLGEPEDLNRSEGYDLGLRVFVGKRQAIVSSSDMSNDALDELVDRAVSMARAVPEDEFCGLAGPDQLATDIPDLDECDPVEPSADQLKDLARLAEEAARSVDGISNSEGAEASWSHTRLSVAATNGFAQSREGSRHDVGVSVLAGDGENMERDYDYTSAVHAADMEAPDVVGRRAGERTVRRLNPQKAETAQVPVVYDPRVAGSLVRHLSSAINGASVARGTSFLKDAMGEQVFASGLNVIDDPLRKRGLRSKPFDAEGVACTRQAVIEDGRLTTWFLDSRSARQLGLTTTGHASRGVSGPPSPSSTNLYLEAGTLSPDDLISAIDNGFYITELIGMGVNGVTGDYSRGASGFWIENGKLSYAVSEMTVAGNLKDMFLHMTPANDLDFRYGVNAPTTRVDGLTVAGK